MSGRRFADEFKIEEVRQYRIPNAEMVYSDQGSQFSGGGWQNLSKAHDLEASLSRHGNCCDNATVENFFQLLKRERIRLKIYHTRREAGQDIFDCIEVFFNQQAAMATLGGSPQ